MTLRYRWLLRVRPAFVASFLKRCLGVRREWTTARHGRFFVDPASNLGSLLLERGEFEPSMAQVLDGLLKPGDVFLDIGANEGYFSVLGAKRVGQHGRVVSIEPQSRLQPVLSGNLAENGAANATVIQAAINDHRGDTDFFLSPDTNPGASGLAPSQKYRTPTETVESTTLERLLQQCDLNDVALAKMDIEGFEYEAILGSKSVFERGLIRHFALEIHPTRLHARGKSPEVILDFLESCGYRRNPAFENLVMSFDQSVSQ